MALLRQPSLGNAQEGSITAMEPSLLWGLSRADPDDAPGGGIHENSQPISPPMAEISECASMTIERVDVIESSRRHDLPASPAADASSGPSRLRVAVFSKLELKKHITVPRPIVSLARQSQ